MSAASGRLKSLGYLLKAGVECSQTLPLNCTRHLHISGIQNGLRSKWRAPMLKEMKRRVDILKEEGKYPQVIRSQFLEWNLDAELYAFGKRLNEEFDQNLLKEALTDSSYVHQESERLKTIGADESKLEMKSNKELAVAGRNLIEDYCTKYMRTVCPLLPEEAVRCFADYLSSDEVLSKIASELGFRDLILKEEHPPSQTTYAGCMAAVVACLNVSSGLERCHKFILDFVVTQLVGKDLWDIWEVKDPLGLLESILVRSGKGVPEPRLIGQLGRNTIEAVLHVGIYDADKKFLGSGHGETVEMAVTVAALDCLSTIFDYSASKKPLPFQPKDLKLLPPDQKNARLSEWKMNL